jgi:hypothetical protein
MLKPRFGALVLVIALFAACGPRTSGHEGISCQVDSDCGPGLKCLTYAVFVDGGADGGCTSLGKICALPCATDMDCGPLDAGFVCSASCNAAPVCVP